MALELNKSYGVRKVQGFCNGYQGFIAKYGRAVLDLTPARVAGINEHGLRITSLKPGQRPPQVVMAARVLEGSKKILRRGPAGSKAGN